MFFGEYQHTMDVKGRISLPARFRTRLTTEVILVKGFDRCLWLFTPEGYEAFLSSLDAREAYDIRLRQIRRFFLSGAQDLELDSAGRVRVPRVLREYADLEKDVVITGNGDRIEFWNVENWNEYQGQIDIESLASGLSADGLL